MHQLVEKCKHCVSEWSNLKSVRNLTLEKLETGSVRYKMRIHNKCCCFSHHRSVSVGGKQLHVDHTVDSGLAVAVVVLTHLGLHLGWRFLVFSYQKRNTKIELCVDCFSSVQVEKDFLSIDKAEYLRIKRGRRKKFRSNTVEARTS